MTEQRQCGKYRLHVYSIYVLKIVSGQEWRFSWYPLSSQRRLTIDLYYRDLAQLLLTWFVSAALQFLIRWSILLLFVFDECLLMNVCSHHTTRALSVVGTACVFYVMPQGQHEWMVTNGTLTRTQCPKALISTVDWFWPRLNNWEAKWSIFNWNCHNCLKVRRLRWRKLCGNPVHNWSQGRI